MGLRLMTRSVLVVSCLLMIGVAARAGLRSRTRRVAVLGDAAQRFGANGAVRRLPLADNLHPFPRNHAQRVTDEPAPPRLYLALELRPATFNDVEIHTDPLRTRCCALQQCPIDIPVPGGLRPEYLVNSVRYRTEP